MPASSTQLMKPQFFLPLMTYPDQTSEVMIANAVDLARNYSAMLHAVAIEVTIPPIADPWAALLIDVDKMVADAERDSALHGQRLEKLVAAKSAAAGIKPMSELLAVNQNVIADVIADVARHYDLSLLQASEKFNSANLAVIFESGRPAILYPDRPFAGRIDHVAVAWDGSRAAARALGDAALFIAAASRVSIIYALDEKPIEQDPGKRLFDSLAARGVKAEACPIHIGSQPIGEALQSKAVELQADLMVMGGYGHSRMREFILGGATADVLAAPLLPVLMSH
jgi:nucleotide-binding universal stress UspA family protein